MGFPNAARSAGWIKPSHDLVTIEAGLLDYSDEAIPPKWVGGKCFGKA